MAVVDEIKIVVKAEVDAAIAKLTQVDKATNKNVKTGADLAKSIAGYTSAYGLAVQAGQAVLRGMGDLVVTSVKLAAAQERVRMEFSVLTGSMEKGNKLFDQMNKLASETPLEMMDIAAAGKQLLSVGVPVGEITEKLRMLGDVAMGNPEKLDRLTQAFGQLRSKGVASMEQLNRFIEAGVPIMSELQKQTGKTGDEVFKMVSQGKIGYPQVEQALRALTGEGGLMHDMMKQVSQTTEGKFSTALDNAKMKLAEIGKTLIPVVTSALNAFNEAMDRAAGQAALDKIGSGAARDLDTISRGLEYLQGKLAKYRAAADDINTRMTLKQIENLSRLQMQAVLSAEAAKPVATTANNTIVGESEDDIKKREKAMQDVIDQMWFEAEASAQVAAIQIKLDAMTPKNTGNFIDFRDALEQSTSAAYSASEEFDNLWKEMVGANEATIALTDAQKEWASILGGAMTSSFSALGEALANGENGWEAWGKAGMNAIAGVLEQLAAAEAVAGFGMLIGGNPFGLAKLGGAAAMGTAAGVIRAEAAKPSTGASVTNNYVIQNVSGSIRAEKELQVIAANGMAKAARGY